MVADQLITDNYAIYCGDCIPVMKNIPSESIHLTLYSPPFAGLYIYSSDERDMSNAINRQEFFEHYGYALDEIARITMPGRISAVHCMDIPLSNAGCDDIYDFPGDIIREHEKRGFVYGGRRAIWKEPLMVRNRTMMKSLHHKTLCEDSTRCSIANADYLLMFRKKGTNKIPVEHLTGFNYYAGENQPPANLYGKDIPGDQKKNEYSQYIWRQYASSVWMDIRVDNVLPYISAKDDEDEKHVHPLQLDVIERCVQLWSNHGEVVLTPFMGVGSEVYGAVKLGRIGVGIELKQSYYTQAIRNLASLTADNINRQQNGLF